MIRAGGLAVVLTGGGERAIPREVGALAGLADGGVTVVHASPPELVAMGRDPLSAATGHLAVVAGRDRGRALALQIRPSRAA